MWALLMLVKATLPLSHIIKKDKNKIFEKRRLYIMTTNANDECT